MPENDIHDSSQHTTLDSPVQNDSRVTEVPVAESLIATPIATTPDSQPDSQEALSNSAITKENGDAADESSDESSFVALLDETANPERDAAEAVAAESGEDHDATLEIDHRRAKQLLDRALLLSERGDLAGAILASRQAVALTPSEPSGYSLLGLLHERAGDLEKAINSYEKVLQLAPQSTLERDSLDRLKSTLESENSSVLFHFDDNELFEEPAAIASPVVAAVEAPAQVAETASVTAKPIPQPVLNSAPSVQTALPDIKPLAMPAKVASGRSGLTPYPSLSRAQQPTLQLLMRKPSFYFKGAPIVAATTVGLLFMAWAEGVSQNKYLQETLPGAPSRSMVIKTSNVGADGETQGDPMQGPVQSPQQAVNANGGGIFGQGNPGSSPTTSVVSPGAPAPRVSANGGSNGGSNATAPVSRAATGVQALPPAIPQPNGAVGGSTGSVGSGSTGGSNTLETLPVMRPRVPVTETVRPSTSTVVQGTAPAAPATDTGGGNSGGNSSQGGMFNPSTSPRGYIRIDPVRPVNPVTPAARPSNEARAAENAASRAAASGRTNEVVPSLNRAIERQATGYTYQRRAMAFMGNGDYSRAADDFQSAIAAYQDQIRQNQNVEDARNGIQTCKSGLNLALSRMGR